MFPEIEIDLDFYSPDEVIIPFAHSHFILRIINKGNDLAKDFNGKIIFKINNKEKQYPLKDLFKIGAIKSGDPWGGVYRFPYKLTGFKELMVVINYLSSKNEKYVTTKTFFLKPFVFKRIDTFKKFDYDNRNVNGFSSGNNLFIYDDKLKNISINPKDEFSFNQKIKNKRNWLSWLSTKK